MNGFYVSFRARHPDRDLGDLLAHLGVRPERVWKAGEKRYTPAGENLEGIYESSYYCCNIPIANHDDLAVWLTTAIDFLNPIAHQLASFTEEGGSLSFYIGLESGIFEGATLHPKILSDLGALCISLEIDRSL